MKEIDKALDHIKQAEFELSSFIEKQAGKPGNHVLFGRCVRSRSTLHSIRIGIENAMKEAS